MRAFFLQSVVSRARSDALAAAEKNVGEIARGALLGAVADADGGAAGQQ